jgi:AraC-like DNA-binding protein
MNNLLFKNRLKVTMLFVCLLGVGTNATAQQTVQQQKDSLRQIIPQSEGSDKIRSYQRLALLYFAESTNDDLQLDTLFAIYADLDAEAKRQGNPKTQGLVMANKIFALRNREDFDEIIRLAPAYLDFTEKHEIWDHYYLIYERLFVSNIEVGKLKQALLDAQQLFETARSRKHNYGMYCAMHAMAYVYEKQNRPVEHEQCIRECIELLEELLKEDKKYISLLAQVLGDLTQSLIGQNRYEEVLPVAQRLEEVNHRFEAYTQTPVPTTWANLWQIYIVYYLHFEDYDKVEYYCDKEEELMTTDHKTYIYNGRAQVYKSRGQYDKALKEIDKGLAKIGDRMTMDVIDLKKLKIDILYEMKRTDEAYKLWREITVLTDSIRNVEFSASIDELHTQYEVDKHIAEKELNRLAKERNRNYFLFSLGVCLLLLILLGIGIYYNRIITKKNRGLYRQIKEQDYLKEELEQLTRRYENLLDSVPPSVEIEVEEESKRPGDKQQNELVRRLNKYLLDDKNFSNTDIDLDGLAPLIATNRRYLFESVKVVTGKTLMEYIHTLRLNEARQLLDNNFDLTIEAIAADSGFNNRQTFYRLFKEQYNISPAEYRKMVKNR